MNTLGRRWFRADEIAEYLHLNPKTVYSLCSRGMFPHIKKPGVGLRIDKVKLDQMLEEDETLPVKEQLKGKDSVTIKN
jgi:excisionase family DNA binding protein